ncbi:MAG: DUF5615 family PIN-like protein [Chitinophagales bacterium]
MAKYLVDANLPYYFSMWNTTDYVHQFDINDEAKDHEIWKYAKENNLTIITKDSDFADRILLKEPPPKVIHIRFGNMKMNDFFNTLSKVWGDVIKISETNKLVSVYIDRIEAVS